MKKRLFQINEGPIYMGYTNGDYWNGWATPYFPLKEALRICYAWNNEYSPMVYDKERDEFRLHYEGDDEPYIWKGEDIQTEDGIQHLYGIGAYSHIWDDLGDEDKRYLAEQICEFLVEYDIDLYEDHYECGDDFLEDILDSLADINVFADAYYAMNNGKLAPNEIYTLLRKALQL